ncbi:MAG: hypothetical protein ACK4LS_04870, partial [Microbacterium sp.]
PPPGWDHPHPPRGPPPRGGAARTATTGSVTGGTAAGGTAAGRAPTMSGLAPVRGTGRAASARPRVAPASEPTLF